MMNMPSEKNSPHLLEQHLERQALPVCRSATLVQCLKDYGLEPLLTVTPSDEEKPLFIRVNDIAATKKRFFQQTALDQSLYPLSTELKRTVELYEHFLLNDYTPRYRLLVSHQERQWLRRVLTLLVVRYLMEQKYERSKDEGGIPFADAWAGGEMQRIMLMRDLPGLLAQMVHHIEKDPEQSEGMIDQFFTGLDIRIKGCLVLDPQPLPPLPSGTSLPLALASVTEEPHDE